MLKSMLMETNKNMSNTEIADLLRSVAAAYQIIDDKKNRFKIIAYEKAADAVEHLSSEAKDLWDDGKLDEVSGIGPNIGGHLGEIFKTGSSQHFHNLLKEIPSAVFELIKLPGVGPKNGLHLVKKLNIKKNPLDMLMKHAMSGKIAKLEGFGLDSQNAIIKAIEEFKNKGEKRMLLPYALSNAQLIIEWMKRSKVVKRVDVLGSLRRRNSTVGDIDIAVATDSPKEALEHFTKYPDAKRIFEKGEKTAGIIIPPELHVDLMVQEPESYGALLQHFTGSKHHNIKLREFAQKKGLSLSEYGIKKVRTDGEKASIDDIKKFSKEKHFYNYLGMQWIPPEIREDRGEIEKAAVNKLPQLLELQQVKADLQIHSDFDIETSHDLGSSSMEDIVRKANELGYEYVAFTEHNPSQKGHTDKDILELLKRKKEAVDKLNENIKPNYILKKVFNSLEIDILPNGELPVCEEGLELLDFALVSIHSSFRLERNEMTKRVLNALNMPKVKIFAHPTGRKINEREGVELNWDEIFEFCLKNEKLLEVNADPMRLDLPDTLVFDAVKKGVKLTLGTDSHHVQHMSNMVYGVNVARRGWATQSDIVNCLSLEEFEKMLK